MENTKHAVLRKLFTGVEQGEPANRWGKNQRAGKSSNNAGPAVVPSRGIPVTGSVRERAKAFEERYAGNSNAFVPCPTPTGSAGQRPAHRVAKTSGDRTANEVSPAKLSDQTVEKQAPSNAVDVAKKQPKPVEHKETANTRRDGNVLTSKTAFPPQRKSPSRRGNTYELPASSPKVQGGQSASRTPQRQEKHVSSPPSQPPSGQNTKPTLRAGAFQAARSRSNSMPRPSEWFVSPPSQTQSSTSQTKSEVLQRPNVRPQSVIAASPSPDSQPIRVSALPISQSRKSRASLESVVQYPVARPSSVSIPSRPRIPQRSVSAHPNVFNRPVKDVAEVEPEARHNVSQDVYMQLPASARSDPIPGGSAEMGRAKSAPGEVAASPVKARPRSLTLTAQNPADLDSMFKEFIESLNLPETVSRRMLSVDARVKLDMLRSGTPASTVSKATGQSMTGAIQSRMPIPSFGEVAEAAKPSKKRPTMLRKMKSFMSNKETSPETPEGFLMVEPTSPLMDTLASSATSRMSFDYSKDIDPVISQAAAAQAHMIKSKPLKALDPVKDVRKLRVLLRNESLSWVSEWIKFGGYRGLMERLHEVVTLEWREEQHDDQVLLELLKCFRGLLMSQPGRQCLATFSPSPFRPLIELLFSDKKPGELPARQCIVEIVAGLFDVSAEVVPEPIAQDGWRKPWSSRDNFGADTTDGTRRSSSSQNRSQTGSNGKSPQLPALQFDRRAGKGSEGSSTWESAGFGEDYSFVNGSNQELINVAPAKEYNSFAAYLFVKSLIIGPPNEKEEAQVYFIKSTRKTRLFKLWMDEVIGVLSDYFWIFCHSSNSYWRLENIQEDQIEEPKVPGGMTGGVEYEAMEYCSAHLRLLNRLCKHVPAGEAALELHSDLFASGIDKVLLVHLELARYIDLCLSSGYPLHPGIRKYIEPVTSLKESISAGKLAKQALEQGAKSAKKGHHRSRTDGQIMLSKEP